MLNKNRERELAYVVRVNEITPMNADRLECAHIDGWHCVVGKGEFRKGDLAIYFEIDSQLPEVFPFNQMEFLKSKKYKIRTQKIRGEYSQGLLVPLMAFVDDLAREPAWLADLNLRIANGEDVVGTFLTKELGVTYAVAEDNARKASSIDKYKKMARRRPKLFAKPFARWMMRREWGKKIMFFFFGKKKDKKNGWPQWVVKTDEERVQNMPWLFPDNAEEWIVTEKIDGTSTTFTMRGYGRKRQFYVCSRNVVFNEPNKECFYETNVYTEMAKKYYIEKTLAAMLDAHGKKGDIEFITIQGETYGQAIQKRDYGLKEHRLAVFNIIYGFKNGHTKRLNPLECKAMCETIGLPCVPVVYRSFFLPKTCEELLEIATGKSQIDGGMREGLVFRSVDGIKSFKTVSNEYLVKYHG